MTLCSSSLSIGMETKDTLICQGAESKIFATMYCGLPAVIKQRLSKQYRVKELDIRINKQRLLQETRCIVKCRKAGVLTPCLYLLDVENNSFIMEKISGRSLKELIRKSNLENENDRNVLIAIMKGVGASIAKMHDTEVIHGDLTTSNVMVNEENAPVLIDFGLGMMKPTIEDKAVDLYVLERAFVSTHPGSDFLVAEILDTYRISSRKGSPTLMKLEQVRLRGRKRDMIG